MPLGFALAPGFLDRDRIGLTPVLGSLIANASRKKTQRSKLRSKSVAEFALGCPANGSILYARIA